MQPHKRRVRGGKGLLTWYRPLVLLNLSVAESFAFKAWDLMSANDGIACVAPPLVTLTAQAQAPGEMKDASDPNRSPALNVHRSRRSGCSGSRAPNSRQGCRIHTKTRGYCNAYGILSNEWVYSRLRITVYRRSLGRSLLRHRRVAGVCVSTKYLYGVPKQTNP